MSWLITSTVRARSPLVFGALVFTAPFAFFYLIRRAFGWRAALWSAPVVWTAWDWLYQQSEGSFGWLTMSVTQSNLYWLVQYVDTTGVWGVTFWLVLFNVLVVMAVEDWLAERSRTVETKRAGRFLARRLALVAADARVPLAYSLRVRQGSAAAKDEGRELSSCWCSRTLTLGEDGVRAAGRATEDHRLDEQGARRCADETRPHIWPETAVPYVLSKTRARAGSLSRRRALADAAADRAGDARAKDEGAVTPNAADAPRGRELFNSAALLSPAPEMPVAGSTSKLRPSTTNACWCRSSSACRS